MMDAYGEFDPPPEAQVKQTIFDDVKGVHPNYDDTQLRTVIDQEFERFGGIQALGSMAGWLVYTRMALGSQVIAKMENMRVHIVAHSQSL